MVVFNSYIKAHIMCASFLIISTLATAQYNLVPNFSFEEYTVSCSSIDLAGGVATNWVSPVVNLAEYYGYFNACATKACCGVPISNSGYGYQYARTGVGYAGIITFLEDNIRDYLQAQLLDTLQANHKYYIEFYANLNNVNDIGCNNLGLLVGDTSIKYYKRAYTPASPQIQQYGNPVITDTLNWVRVGGVYKAHGGEQYITIGNFNDNAHTDTVTTDINAIAGGYGIEDVSVIPLDSMLLYADAGRDTTIYKGDSAWIGTRLCGLTNVVWYDSINGTKDTFATNVPGMWVKPTSSNYYIITQTVNGFYSTDTVWVRVKNPLPVSIINYQLSITGEKEVVNSWHTATELNTGYFIVQHSTDGKSFVDIGTVKAVGKGTNSYQFIDESPASGVNYYRLKSVDKDGSFGYSKVLSIQKVVDDGIKVYPNPSKGEINVQLPLSGNWEVTITDVTGRVVWQQVCNGCEGTILHYIEEGKGLYFVRIINNSTGRQAINKIVLE